MSSTDAAVEAVVNEELGAVKELDEDIYAYILGIVKDTDAHGCDPETLAETVREGGGESSSPGVTSRCRFGWSLCPASGAAVLLVPGGTVESGAAASLETAVERTNTPCCAAPVPPDACSSTCNGCWFGWCARPRSQG